jgi:programmed cell death 6-interacting protein
MPMLSFPGKKALRFAGDTSAAERDSELAVLMHARNHVVLAMESAGAATAAETAAALRVYLRIIYASELMSGSKQQKLRFAWRDSSDAGTGTGTGTAKKKDKAAAAAQVQEHTSLEAERAVAMFALAAELARTAAAVDRRGPEGTRRACVALSDAAGALKAAARAHGAADQLCHMTEPCLATFERLMLAQALECFFERAVAGGKQSALCAPRSPGRCVISHRPWLLNLFLVLYEYNAEQKKVF